VKELRLVRSSLPIARYRGLAGSVGTDNKRYWKTCIMLKGKFI
jgi:hypothetical protein